MVLVSVIVPTRDRPALLREALASIRALEGPDLRFEIAVGNNGGFDGVREACVAFGACHVPVSRPGAAAARNAALAVTKARLVAFLDDDDAWLPGHVRPHLAFLREHRDYAGAVGQVCNASGDLSSHAPPWPASLPAGGDLFESFLGYYPQLGATVVRRAAIERIGGFDESLTFDQDWDWHLRLALAFRVGFVAEPCVLFRQREIGADDDLQWRRLGFTWRVLGKNLRRAGLRRGPSLPVLAKALSGKLGQYEDYFMQSAKRHREAGDTAAARQAVLRALVSSPPHALRDIASAPAAWKGYLPG